MAIRSDALESLKPIKIIGRALAIVPKKCDDGKAWICFYMYQICVMVVYVWIYLYTTYGKIVYMRQELATTVFITEVVSDFCLAFTTIGSILIINILKGRGAVFFMNSLEDVDADLAALRIDVNPHKVRFYLELIFIHLVFIAYFSYYSYVWVNSVGFYIFRFFFIRDFQNYHALILAFLLRQYALLIKFRSEALNNALKQIKEVSNKVLCIITPVHNDETELNIQNLRKVYTKLLGILEIYNNTFGWCFLGLYINIVCTTLGPVNIAVVYGNGDREIAGTKFGLSLILLCITCLFLPLVNSWAIFSSCSETSDELLKMPHICYDLIKDLPNDMYLKTELRDLAHETSVSRPEFSAAGFFTVDYTILFALAGSVSSYLIVLIQFTK